MLTVDQSYKDCVWCGASVGDCATHDDAEPISYVKVLYLNYLLRLKLLVVVSNFVNKKWFNFLFTSLL